MYAEPAARALKNPPRQLFANNCASSQPTSTACVDAAQALQSMRDTYEGPTARAEGAVFPSVMAAFFAVLALSSLGAAFLAVRGPRPRVATVATMALWSLVAVLMFLGAGTCLCPFVSAFLRPSYLLRLGYWAVSASRHDACALLWRASMCCVSNHVSDRRRRLSLRWYVEGYKYSMRQRYGQ